MPKCKRPGCNGNVIKDSPSHFICSGPGGCGKSYHISCARIFVQTIASAPCCRSAVKAFDYNKSQINSAAFLHDKNRPLQNCSTYFSDESVANISNTVIQTSSPNSILNMNFSQLAATNSQPLTSPNITSQFLPQTTSNSSNLALLSQPVTSSSSVATITSSSSITSSSATTAASTVTTSSNTIINTALVIPCTSNNQNLLQSNPTTNFDQRMQVDISNNQLDAQSNNRIIKPMGPPIIYPMTDGIESTDLIADLITEHQTSTSMWATSSTDEKLLQIMTGISSLQTSVNTFQQGYNTLVQKCGQIEAEVRQNRDYITGVNEDLLAVHNVATTAFNAIKVAEMDIQKVHNTFSTSDTQFLGRETVISGLPAHCQMSDREVADRFMVAIGADHLIFHITEVRELKAKHVTPENQDYYKLIVKFSSFQLRKDVMVLKRRRGKVTYGDLFAPTEVPQDANKVLYFNDLLPLDLHKRYTKIINFFKLNRNINVNISIFCNEGQIFFRRNRDPPVLIPDDFDLNMLHTL